MSGVVIFEPTLDVAQWAIADFVRYMRENPDPETVDESELTTPFIRSMLSGRIRPSDLKPFMLEAFESMIGAMSIKESVVIALMIQAMSAMPAESGDQA